MAEPQTQPPQAPPAPLPAGVCTPFDEVARQWPAIRGDAQLVQRVHEDIDALAYTFIWQCLLSF
jgi:hypothetical protein